VGTPDTAYSQYRMHAQEAANNININTDTNGWDGSVVSALRPYTIRGAYQSRDGTFV